MRVLLAGDSLIRGNVGVDWVASLANKRPEWRLENAGVNGETLTLVSRRLERMLEQDGNYNRIVLAAGANDILIPYLSQKGFLFRKAGKHLLNKGFQPLEDPLQFETTLRACIESIRNRSRAKIILTTIGCLNEDLSFPLNHIRHQFNEIIRDTAWDMDCRLADPGHLFEEYLEDRNTTNYFLENFFASTWLDKWQCKLFGCADHLSRSRQLLLTIDGLHLNSLGGRFFRNEIEKQIKRP